MLTREHYYYYQPLQYLDDGTNIDWKLPPELFSFMAFASEDDCKEWLESMGYDVNDFKIMEYQDDDIEEVTILRADGVAIPAIESYSDDELFDGLLAKILEMNHDIEEFEDKKREDESQQEYEDRLYGTAHTVVMNEIERVEESGCYNFAYYGANPDVEWYDNVIDDLIQEVMRIMTSNND